MDTKLEREPENSAVMECKGGGYSENWFQVPQKDISEKDQRRQRLEV